MDYNDSTAASAVGLFDPPLQMTNSTGGVLYAWRMIGLWKIMEEEIGTVTVIDMSAVLNVLKNYV